MYEWVYGRVCVSCFLPGGMVIVHGVDGAVGGRGGGRGRGRGGVLIVVGRAGVHEGYIQEQCVRGEGLYTVCQGGTDI